MQNGRSPVFPQKHTWQDQQENILSACTGWVLSHTGGSGMGEPPDPHSPSPAALSPNHKGKRWKETHPTYASTTMAGDDDSDSDGEEAAQRTRPGLGSVCSLWGTCSISQVQDNSHQRQVICCNIVARSYSQFAELCDVLGVLGLPQSTAGERYEISIYRPQPGQESDN